VIVPRSQPRHIGTCDSDTVRQRGLDDKSTDRWLGFVLLACFVVLFLQLNNFQVRQANSLVHNRTRGESARPLHARARRHLQF